MVSFGREVTDQFAEWTQRSVWEGSKWSVWGGKLVVSFGREVTDQFAE